MQSHSLAGVLVVVIGMVRVPVQPNNTNHSATATNHTQDPHQRLDVFVPEPRKNIIGQALRKTEQVRNQTCCISLITERNPPCINVSWTYSVLLFSFEDMSNKESYAMVDSHAEDSITAMDR